ncbi:FMN-binding protein [Amycolatopsis sp. FDAARGOS 1241]|uniref:FMN-binding protein n=1 Tax=Amycolatopsis sp. FDAARGOS 1241 TaxID=2778070 RepID=UPI00194F436C|nr:FMN-binding protein [Amycolatopsis sp. FDAARGOS 1241]QRP44505.1 FMN-binding protein [Amycolatopsis sp. FDAARGOS 1241]
MKKTIFVVALSIAGFIAVWRFDPAPASTATTPPASAAPSTSAGSGAVTTQGTAESTEFGTVQVQVAFDGSRITDVTLVQQPDSGRGVDAIPLLREEALQAQSADIGTVSGATQTSESYIKSLQAALDARRS